MSRLAPRPDLIPASLAPVTGLFLVVAAALLAWPGVAGAEQAGTEVTAPERSARPLPRAGTAPARLAMQETIDSMVTFGQPRPRWRPTAATRPGLVHAALTEAMVSDLDLTGAGAGAGQAARPDTAPATASTGQGTRVASAAAVSRSFRPQTRPDDLAKAPGSARLRDAFFHKPKGSGRGVATGRGAICGDASILGQQIPDIPGRISGCGVRNPVAVTAVDGVVLSTPAKMDCTTAKALKSWVRNGIKPAVGRKGGGVKSLKVAAHYSCRTRNNRKGGKISEHGKGRAIDISEIRLQDGSTLSVLQDWRKSSKGSMLKQMHQSACGPFGTVLGPSADRYHQDHFHLDTARYRKGSYCR